MSMWLRQSTASQEVLLGRFVDSTDGNTEETALTINNTDIKLWVEGATTLASKNSGGATHIANGNYYCVLDATDTATLGKMEVHVHVSGALSVKREFMVLPAMIYDSLVLGTDRFDANVTHIGDTSQTARDIGASVLLSSGTGTGQLKLASGYVAMTWADIAAPTTSVALTGTTIATTQKVDVETIKTNPVVNAGTITFPTGSTLASTTNITAAAGIAVSSIGTGVITATSIADGAIDAATFAAGAITAAAIATGAIDADALATDAVTEIAAGINVPTAAAVATAVWQDTTAGDFTVSGSIGKSLFTSGAVPGAAGGLQIAGSNAATTFATLTVSGATTLTGAVSLGNTLGVAGATTFTGAITATNASNSISGVALSTTGIAAIYSTAITEPSTYGTDGSALTGAQLQYLILSHLGDFVISGTSKNCKKLDGSTNAAVYTLNSATLPTSITRTS